MLSNRIPAQPPSRDRVIIAVAVVEQGGLGVLILGREPERHLGGDRAGGHEQFSEGAIFVMGGDSAGGVEVIGDVAVAVGEGVIRAASRPPTPPAPWAVPLRSVPQRKEARKVREAPVYSAMRFQPS